jgi:hypothetical protein
MWILENMQPSPFKTMSLKDNNAINTAVDLGIHSIAAYCRPPETTLNVITDVFCKYLRDMPEKRHGLPAILFNDAMTKAWSCG